MIGARIFGSLEIELGAIDVGLARGDVGLRLPQVGNRKIKLRLRDRPRRKQRFGTLVVLCLLIEHGLRLGERRLGGVELDPERLGVELVEHVAGFDVAALLEIPVHDDARDTGAHLGDARRRNAAGQLPNHRQRRGLQFKDAHLLRRRRLSGRRGRAFGAGRQHQSRKKETCGNSQGRQDFRHVLCDFRGVWDGKEVFLSSQLRKAASREN